MKGGERGGRRRKKSRSEALVTREEKGGLEGNSLQRKGPLC